MIDGIKANLELGPTMCSEPTSVNMQEEPLQVSRGYTERDMIEHERAYPDFSTMFLHSPK